MQNGGKSVGYSLSFMNPMVTDHELSHIPSPLLQWLAQSRCNLLDDLEQGRQVQAFPAHLPVTATWSGKGEFPVNLSVKGIGLVPRRDLLSKYAHTFEEVFKQAQDMDWGQSFPLRASALRALYSDPSQCDPGLLGGLEIFEGKTLQNLTGDPRISLLYMGMLPQPQRVSYLSFQINGRVEKRNPHDLYYRVLLAARRLFEFDRFHLPQSRYPLAYLVKVTEVLDKSPFIRKGE